MCGVAGLARLDGAPTAELALGRMLDCLRHRGPDGGGFYRDDGHAMTHGTHAPLVAVETRATPGRAAGATLALGHRRLAITDLSTRGAQPMSWGDGRWWVSFNGAIYNAPELREELAREGDRFRSTTDTEVLVAAIARWGEAALDRFNGMWAFALWDATRRELLCARDRFGVKGLVYAQRGPLLAFASEPKALREVLGTEADMAVVERFLSHGIVCGEGESVYRDVASVPAGGLLRASAGGVTVRRWYEAKTRPAPVSFAAATEELRALLTASVRLRLRADVAVGACLSGGLDSSALVALAAHRSGSPLVTVSTEYPAQRAIDESMYARDVARANGCDARFVTPTEDGFDRELDDHVHQLDDLFPHSGSYAQRVVYRTAREAGLPAMLSGQGADELFGGYEPWAVYLAELRATRRRGRAVVEAFLSGERQTNIRGGVRRVLGELRRSAREVGGRSGPSAAPEVPRWVGARVRDAADQHVVYAAPTCLRAYLDDELDRSHLPALLRFEDRNAMASGVEARLPFLDVRIVDFARALPSDHLLRWGATKAVLRAAVSDLLPASIVARRTKLGFPGPIEASADARAPLVVAAWARLAAGGWVSGAFPVDPRTREGRALGLRARVLDSFTRRCLGGPTAT